MHREGSLRLLQRWGRPWTRSLPPKETGAGGDLDVTNIRDKAIVAVPTTYQETSGIARMPPQNWVRRIWTADLLNPIHPSISQTPYPCKSSQDANPASWLDLLVPLVSYSSRLSSSHAGIFRLVKATGRQTARQEGRRPEGAGSNSQAGATGIETSRDRPASRRF